MGNKSLEGSNLLKFYLYTVVYIRKAIENIS